MYKVEDHPTRDLPPHEGGPVNVKATTAPSPLRPIAGMQYTLGMLGIVIGTLMAMVVLPDNYYEPGQLRVAAFALSLGLISAPAISSMTDIRAWMRAESVMMIGLIYWLLIELFAGDYAAYELTRAGVLKAFGLIGLFGILILAGSRLAYAVHNSGSRVSNSNADFSLGWLYNALLVCSFLGLLARLIPCNFSPACMADGLFSARGVGAWSRGVIGGSGAFASHLQYFGYLAVPLTVALHHRTGRVDWRVAVGIALATLFLLFLIKDGGRRLVGMVLGSGLIAWLLLQPRLGGREIFVASMSALGMLALLQVMLFFRGEEGGIVSSLFSGRAFGSDPLGGGIKVDNNFIWLTKTLDLIPEFKNHTGWTAIIYWAVRPIPRVFWPDKPIGPGINLPCELGQCWGDNFTLTVSAIGDWYVSFGVYSVAVAALVMGFLGGKLVLVWFGPTVRQKLLYSMGLMWLFIGLRSYLELILMSYPIIALYAIGKLTMRSKSAQASSTTQPRTAALHQAKL